MITHEDIKVVISLKVRCNKEVRKYLNDYIAQQEKKEERAKKVEELLDLYQYVWKKPIFSQTLTFDEMQDRIDILEKELEEMK